MRVLKELHVSSFTVVPLTAMIGLTSLSSSDMRAKFSCAPTKEVERLSSLRNAGPRSHIL